MKNLSKVLAVVLALVMALSMVSFAAYTDVAEDANYAEAVTVLSSLEMLKGYEDGTFKPEGDITRAEFAMVVCRLLGYGATAENPAATQFVDVTADHWASGAIALAASQGIVNGYGNGYFGPNDNVTYEQAIKMVVAALGCGIVAEANGGYPGGYQIVAAQKGILDGITDGKVGVAASRGVVAQLAYNALTVPMFAQTAYGSETKYEPINALLLNKIGVTKFIATVEGTAKSDASLKANEVKLAIESQYTAIKGNADVAKKAVGSGDATPDLDGSIFDAASTKVKFDTNSTIGDEATALIDYSVEAYVKDATTNKPELVAIVKRNVGNTEVAYAAEDINMDETVKTATNVSSLAVYTEDEDYEEYDLDIKKVYVNGRVVDTATGDADEKQLFEDYTEITADADIRLLDNDGDEVYTIAYITAYYDFVVEAINAKAYKIMAKNVPTHPVMGSANATLILDEENENFIFDIIKDGEKVDFSAIAKNDVLSVAGTINGNKELTSGTVIINTQSVAGKIDGYNSDDAEISIDGVPYAFKNLTWGVDINLGDEATFYINARGIICGLDEATKASNLKYGFATVAALSTGLTANTFEFRMMDATGAWNTYTLADDAKVNTKVAGAADLDTLAEFATEVGGSVPAGDKTVINKVAGYELNDAGEVKTLLTVHTTDDFEIDADDGSKQYNATVEMINGKTITDATVIFSTPTLSAGVAIDEDTVSVATKAVLVDRENYDFDYFNIDDDGVPAVACGANIVGRIDWAGDILVVSSANISAKGDKAGVIIKGIVNGEEVQVFASTEAGKAAEYDEAAYDGTDADAADSPADLTSATIGKGDILIYTTDAAGEVKKIVRLYKGTDIKAMLDASTPKIVDVNASSTVTMDDIALGVKEAAGTPYNFYLGYIAEAKSSRIGLVDGADADATDFAARTALTVKADSVVTEVDFYYAGSNTKVTAGDIGSFNYDAGYTFSTPAPDLDGDIVFVRAINGTVVKDAITFRAND